MTVTRGPPYTYANIAASAVPATGAVLSEGFIQTDVIDTVGTINTFIQMPGTVYLTFLHTSAPTSGELIVPIFGVHDDDEYRNIFPRGLKVYIKGTYKASSDTPFLATYERFAIGMLYEDNVMTSVTQNVANFRAENEVSRDDIGSLAVVVDDSENIKYYNTALSSDASYTDSGFDADLSAGMEFEMILDTAYNAVGPDDIFVTIKIRDGGGTMRTIVNGLSNPITSATAQYWVPVIGFNQDGYITNFAYKIEKKA